MTDPDLRTLAGQALDGSLWRVGSRHGIHLYRQPGPAGIGEPIGTMLTPELAAQVAAEHRYCVEVRALFAAAEQSHREPERPDDLDVVAARLGFVPVADRDLAQGLADMRGAALAGLIAEQDEMRRELARVRGELAAANAAIGRARAKCQRWINAAERDDGPGEYGLAGRAILAVLAEPILGAGPNSTEPREDDTDA